jgi:hypothetical protein
MGVWWSVGGGGGETHRYIRNSNRCDIEERESTHMSSVGGRKESI